MITAEDYNIFPQTNYGSIQKIKAVNRTSSGVSLYLDTLDPTGSFSSTNIFGDDGIIGANVGVSSSKFDFLTDNDIYAAVYNQIIPIINSTEIRNYYYGTTDSFPRLSGNTDVVIGGNITFNQNTVTTSSTTGFLVNPDDETLTIGANVYNYLRYVDVGASLQFSAPAGSRFNRDHELVTGSTLTNAGDSLNFYATVTGVVSDADVTAPNKITFGTVVPTGAVLSDVDLTGANAIAPAYKNDLSSGLIATVITQIKALLNFGLRYNTGARVVNTDGTLGSYGVWENITPAETGDYASWLADSTALVRFEYTQGLYTIYYKTLAYTFSSAGNTKFYFDPTTRVYNSLSGTNVQDTIKILKINSVTPEPLDNDVVWQIYNTITAADGYTDKTKVLVRAPTTQAEYVPDNPDLYSLVSNGTSTSDLYFQYKHNVPARSRIDPTPVNIMDVYILTSTYTTNYTNWLRDLTGTVTEPALPTSTSLETSYNNLDNYKAVSDTLVYNPAKFKPLFGAKADQSLHARFQVVKNPSANITDNEIKSQVISAINTYFDVSNWDFGESFYFSELAAYLHSKLVPNISSVVIVPATGNTEKDKFGQYFQINAEPWEIITSAATVNDVEIVAAVTAAYLNLSTPITGSY